MNPRYRKLLHGIAETRHRAGIGGIMLNLRHLLLAGSLTALVLSSASCVKNPFDEDPDRSYLDGVWNITVTTIQDDWGESVPGTTHSLSCRVGVNRFSAMRIRYSNACELNYYIGFIHDETIDYNFTDEYWQEGCQYRYTLKRTGTQSESGFVYRETRLWEAIDGDCSQYDLPGTVIEEVVSIGRGSGEFPCD